MRKVKKLTKARIHRKALAARRKTLREWSVKVRAAGRCAVCGSKKFLNAHHLLPKERYPQFATTLENGICLCPLHHKWGAFSFHRNPIWSVLWLRAWRPGSYKWCKNNMGDFEAECR